MEQRRNYFDTAPSVLVAVAGRGAGLGEVQPLCLRYANT